MKANILGTLNIFEVARLTQMRRTVFTSTGKTRATAETVSFSRSGTLLYE